MPLKNINNGLSIVGSNRIAIVRSYDSIRLKPLCESVRMEAKLLHFLFLVPLLSRLIALARQWCWSMGLSGVTCDLRIHIKNARRGGRRGRHPCSSHVYKLNDEVDDDIVFKSVDQLHRCDKYAGKIENRIHRECMHHAPQRISSRESCLPVLP